MSGALYFAAKSRWLPAIRREHAFAREAQCQGHRVVFIESPLDVRDAPRDLSGFTRSLRGEQRNIEEVEVWRRATIAPGHRGGWATRVDNALLSRVLQRSGSAGETVVAALPWQWTALANARAVRRVFDCADNWSALIPERRTEILEAYRRIAGEADAIIAVSPSSASLFPGRQVTIVPNGADVRLLALPPVPSPGTQRMVYVGTLSERFDAGLVAGLLERLPDWTLDLYGECRYSGHGDKPNADLNHLLERFSGRLAWHGVIPRDELAGVLDASDVTIIPNRAEQTEGQSSMKLYDYAARGRATVSTALDIIEGQVPPGTRFASSADDFATAVALAGADTLSQQRIQWVMDNTYAARWPAWSDAAFGTPIEAHNGGLWASGK